MAQILLSECEKAFIINGVKAEFRSDGRMLIDYRPIEIETDVVSHASGSARLRLANTDILVGVKSEIDVPKEETPDMGKIDFFVDCSANATPEFEGRGGEQLATSISNSLHKAYYSQNTFNMKQLCIMVGKQCWKLNVDILILECGGNLYDAVSMAVKGALFNTRLPSVKAALMDGGTVDIQLSDDPYDTRILKIGSAPLMVTLCKIGNACVVDPTAEEEKCSYISLIVAVMGNENNYYDTICEEKVENQFSTIISHGPGSFHPNSMKRAMEQGMYAGTELDKMLGEALLREQKLTGKFKKDSYGFLK